MPDVRLGADLGVSDWRPPDVRSGVDGIAWPALPEGRTAAILALLWQLEQSQWWSAEELSHHQFRQLDLLLRHAGEVPFYRRRWREAGLDPLAALSADGWSAMPLLARADIQEAGKDLLSPRVPATHGRISRAQTSGSTGQTVAVFKTALTQTFWQAFALRDHAWHRRDLSGKLASIRAHFGPRAAPPDGAVLPDWGPPASLLYRTGPSVALRLGADVDVQAAWLLRHDPEYLLTYPSNLAALLGHFRERGLGLGRLREVRAVGETVSADLRRKCREVLGVPLVDVYSSQEVGHMALQCPRSGNYHVQSEGVLLEVLDAAGKPCAPGEIGRVVVTALHNFAMPLIRYELRDYAEVGPPCPCGRGLPTLSRIMGRERNMVMLPSGQRRYPLVGFHEFEKIAPIRQYQAVQRSLETIEMRLVVARPLLADEERRLADVVRRSLGHPFLIDFVYRDELRPGTNGKFEEFLCAVPAA